MKFRGSFVVQDEPGCDSVDKYKRYPDMVALKAKEPDDQQFLIRKSNWKNRNASGHRVAPGIELASTSPLITYCVRIWVNEVLHSEQTMHHRCAFFINHNASARDRYFCFEL